MGKSSQETFIFHALRARTRKKISRNPRWRVGDEFERIFKINIFYGIFVDFSFDDLWQRAVRASANLNGAINTEMRALQNIRALDHHKFRFFIAANRGLDVSIFQFARAASSYKEHRAI